MFSTVFLIFSSCWVVAGLLSSAWASFWPFSCVFVASASFVSSMAKSPFNAYLRAYDEAEPVTWLSSMPFRASASLA